MKQQYWGYHLQVNAAGCDNSKVTNKATLTDWVKALVKDIDMEAHGEPLVEHFGNEEHLQGYTVVQLIKTSNICAHLSDLSGDAYIDVFSCKEFSEQDVIDNIKHWLNPKTIKTTMTLRQA